MSEKNIAYNTPWILHRADPYCMRDSRGKYYFTATVPEYDRVILRCADTLDGIRDAEEKILWTKHAAGPMSENVWAPELHFLYGKWYIYFAAGEKDDIWKIRPYVLECSGDDPMKDEWKELGKIKRSDDDEFSFEAFSLDATVFEHGGSYYYIWAEKVGVGRQISNLYIARMERADKLATQQVLLTTPDYGWERIAYWVNEGPAVLKRNGRIYVTFSASATGAEYCMGMLSASEDSDLLDPASWKKSRQPVLQTSKEQKVFGPGHNSFTTDGEGNDIMAYHARTYSHIDGDPLRNPDRHVMLMKLQWNCDGEPVFAY